MPNRVSILAIVAAMLCLMASSAFCGEESAKEISVKEAAELIKSQPDSILVLDVRRPDEFVAGHLPNAQNLDFFGGRFDLDIQKLPKDKPILLYCRSGVRSGAAVKALDDVGITNILHMSAGMNGWQKAKLPVVKEDKPE